MAVRKLHLSVEGVTEPEAARWLDEMTKVAASEVAVMLPTDGGKLGQVGFSVASDYVPVMRNLTELLMIQRELVVGIYDREALAYNVNGAGKSLAPVWGTPQTEPEPKTRATRTGEAIGRWIVRIITLTGLATVVWGIGLVLHALGRLVFG